MSTFSLDPDFVRKLAALLTETGLSEVEYAEGDKRIRVASGTLAPHMVAAPPVVVAATTPSSKPNDSSKNTHITSPMVGTVYLAPEPGGTPFVKVGDKVKVGDTLLIIEAMKVMNPIKAQTAGTITEIFVSDASPVEFGEPLVALA